MERLPPNVKRHGNGFRAVIQIAGKRHYGPVVPTIGEAEAYVRAFKAAKVPNKVATLESSLELLVEDLESIGVRPATFEFYASHLQAVMEHFGAETPLHRIRPEDVRRFIRASQQAGLASGTIVKRVNCLSRLMKLAVRESLIPFDPTAGIRRPTLRSKRFSALSPDRVLAITERIRTFETGLRSGPTHQERDADLVLVAFFTGMRRSELARLRVQDVDLELGELRVDGKTASRTIPIAKPLRAILERQMTDKAARENFLPNAEAIAQIFIQWRKRLDLPEFSAHMLRHSFASAAAAQGVTPYVLRDLLGHRRLEQVLTYFHSQGDAARSAVDSLLPAP
ncbi:MAG: tyrosine-type recombinase/integrase [Planctomycetota bacterium]